jgi:formylglycine-generating enzyme required for sulfatase activity
MHSRETPTAILAGEFERRLAIREFEEEATGLPSDVASRESRVPGPAATWNGAALINSIGMRFVTVPAGEFLMGVPDAGNFAELPECPVHRVRLASEFLLGVHEVTRGQYVEVIGRVPDGAPERGSPPSSADSNDDRLPVVGITWAEATYFCSQLSERAEERAAARRYRLPTEAEWEYACRAGREEPYDWRPERSSGDQSGDAAGILPPLSIRPVGSYRPNSFGLHDMRGNAWEWTADWFDRDYYVRSPVDNPRGPAEGYLKVVRGGDWRFVGERCHIDYPMLSPWKQNPVVGFRVVCETELPPPAP